MPDLQIALDLGGVGAAARAARAAATTDAGHQLLAVQHVDVVRVEARGPAPAVRPLDRAEAREGPAYAKRSVAALGAVPERQPGLQPVEGWDLDGYRVVLQNAAWTM